MPLGSLMTQIIMPEKKKKLQDAIIAGDTETASKLKDEINNVPGIFGGGGQGGQDVVGQIVNDPNTLIGAQQTKEQGAITDWGKILDDMFKKQTDYTKGLYDTQKADEATKIAESKKSLADIIGNLGTSIKGTRADLLAKQKASGEGLISKQAGERATNLASLKDLLTKQSEQSFSQTAPDILELMSGRGLLQSTGTGQALAKEKGRLGEIVSGQLQGQSLADLTAKQQQEQALQGQLDAISQSGLGFEQQLGLYGADKAMGLEGLDLASLQNLGQSGINALTGLGTAGINAQNNLGMMGIQSGQDLGRAGIERQFGLQDIATQNDLARQIAEIQGNTARGNAMSGIGGMLGAGLGSLIPGGGIATQLLGGGLGGLFGGKF